MIVNLSMQLSNRNLMLLRYSDVYNHPEEIAYLPSGTTDYLYLNNIEITT